MIYQYAGTVFLTAGLLYGFGRMVASPYPNIYNWGDNLAAVAGIVGALSLFVATVAFLWGT